MQGQRTNMSLTRNGHLTLNNQHYHLTEAVCVLVRSHSVERINTLTTPLFGYGGEGGRGRECAHTQLEEGVFIGPITPAVVLELLSPVDWGIISECAGRACSG